MKIKDFLDGIISKYEGKVKKYNANASDKNGSIGQKIKDFLFKKIH